MESTTNRKQIQFLRWFPRALLIAFAFAELFFPLGQFQNSGIGVLGNRLPAFIVLAIVAGTWKQLAWAPRVFIMIFIPFLMMFSLDVFSEHLSFWGTVVALFLHNIPALILVAALVFAWKHELAGAVIFGLVGAALFYLMILRHPPGWMSLHARVGMFLNFVMPAITVSILFLCNWARKDLVNETTPKSPATVGT